jgi:hypothetical protein
MYEFEINQDTRIAISDARQVKSLLDLIHKYPPSRYHWMTQWVCGCWWVTIYAAEQTECCWNTRTDYYIQFNPFKINAINDNYF